MYQAYEHIVFEADLLLFKFMRTPRWTQWLRNNGMVMSFGDQGRLQFTPRPRDTPTYGRYARVDVTAHDTGRVYLLGFCLRETHAENFDEFPAKLLELFNAITSYDCVGVPLFYGNWMEERCVWRPQKRTPYHAALWAARDAAAAAIISARAIEAV